MVVNAAYAAIPSTAPARPAYGCSIGVSRIARAVATVCGLSLPIAWETCRGVNEARHEPGPRAHTCAPRSGLRAAATATRIAIGALVAAAAGRPAIAARGAASAATAAARHCQQRTILQHQCRCAAAPTHARIRTSVIAVPSGADIGDQSLTVGEEKSHGKCRTAAARRKCCRVANRTALQPATGSAHECHRRGTPAGWRGPHVAVRQHEREVRARRQLIRLCPRQQRSRQPAGEPQ